MFIRVVCFYIYVEHFTLFAYCIDDARILYVCYVHSVISLCMHDEHVTCSRARGVSAKCR